MRTLEDDMLKVRGYLDEAEARRRQPATARAPAAPAQTEPLLRLVPPEPGEPVLRLGPPDPSEPAPSPEPPARDQLSLF
jgi:hypothetical protein